MKRSYGFTLLEILVVLTLMTLILAIIPPLVPNALGGAKIKSATRQIASGLNSARSEAISRQKETRLTLDVEEKTFQIGNRQKRLDLPEDTQLTLITAHTEQLSEDRGAIRFFPDGSSTGGRIELGHEHNKFMIDVNWLTGNIQISP